MIVEAFLVWARTAKAAERAKAASALARAYLQKRLPIEQENAALAALAHLVNDSAPSVRRALASAIAQHDNAPRHIVWALANDQPDVAGEILISTSVLSDDDFIELLARGDGLAQSLIASRWQLSAGLCAAICEIAECGAISLLLENPAAKLNAAMIMRLCERFAGDAVMRSKLLALDALTAQARHILLCNVVKDIADVETLNVLLGQSRLQLILNEALDDGVLELIEEVQTVSLPQFIAELIDRDQLTGALLVKAAFLGHGEFVSQALSALCAGEPRKTRKILSTGREGSLRALFQSAGLPVSANRLLTGIALYWRSPSAHGDEQNLLQHLKNSMPDNDVIESEVWAYLSMLERLVDQRMMQKAKDDVAILQKFAA